MRTNNLLFLMFVVCLLQGCITGPTRTALVGKDKSATVEWTKGNYWWVVPFTGTWGAISDVGITLSDTILKFFINGFIRPWTKENEML